MWLRPNPEDSSLLFTLRCSLRCVQLLSPGSQQAIAHVPLVPVLSLGSIRQSLVRCLASLTGSCLSGGPVGPLPFGVAMLHYVTGSIACALVA